MQERTTIPLATDNSSFLFDNSQYFGFDEQNHLTAANGIYGSFSYSYDANGNRTTKVMDGHPENYTYDTASHHLLQTVNGGTRNYTYDANGNTTSNTDRDFVYGENNRLKEAQLNGSPLASYTYNGRGERVLKQGADTTLYYYDQNGQLIAELDEQGNTLREYIYIDGQPLAYVTNSQVHFVHVDHLGTPQVITDSSQQVVWAADYEPFGQTTITTQTVTYNPRFPGQYFDQETGLHYNYFRDYDPATGRYVQSDPIGLDGGLNTYGYVSQNPINSIDPFGLIEWKGKVQIYDVGYFGGFAFLTAELTSECIDGKEYTVFVNGRFIGLNFGFIFAGYSESNETLDDGLSSIDPYVFEGFAGIGIVGAQAGRGYGISDIKLGGARTPTPDGMQPNAGKTKGLGEGILGMIGESWVIGTPYFTSCGCK